MGVRDDLAIGGVDTREVLVLALARLEDACLSVVGGVVRASDTVEDVLTVVGCVRLGGIADLDAERIATHEANGNEMEERR